MQYNFLNIFLDKKELFNQDTRAINPFLLENNRNQIEKLYDYYKSDADLLWINGFLGTGKVQIVNYSLAFLSPDVITLKYNCFESTVLDDILLSFFNDFKKLFAQKVIEEPKIKTENFSQKINSYFTQINKPFVIIIDSFEEILKENRQEILDFLFHLSTFSKIKLVVVSRTFESSYFENKNINYQRISTYALEKSIFEKFLKSEKVKCSGAVLEEFYNYTRGYYFFTLLTLKLINHNNTTLEDFFETVKKSFLSFDNHLEKKAIEMVPSSIRNLFWFLAMLRHPVSIDLLKTLSIYDEEKINFLIDNLIFTKDGQQIFVQDCFREQLDTAIAPHVALKIRKYIVDLYETQLPLKPFERNIMISRQTMRKEIEYHSLFLPKRLKTADSADVNVDYLAYAKGKEFDYGQQIKKELKLDLSKTKINPLQKTVTGDRSGIKNVSLNISSLPFQIDGEAVAGDFAIEGQGANFNFSAEAEKDEERLPLNELIDRAESEESKYHYSRVIELYTIALKKEDDENYSTLLPMINAGLAFAYNKVADYEKALKYYYLAQDFYEQAKDMVQANYIKLRVAKILYDTYKMDYAKEILLSTIKCTENPDILNVKAYLQLSNIEDSLSNSSESFNWLKKAIEISNESMEVETMTELYFKYALSLDEKNEIKPAIEYYEKCINLNSNPSINKFLSSAFSNIATLYHERGELNLAVKNYLKAYDIDKQNSNYDGMYYSASKLASMLHKKYPDEAHKYFKAALESSKFLNDVFYMATASLALGDFYYNRKQDEQALRQYCFAMKLVSSEFSKENVDKIKMRINDIKFRMGEKIFDEAMKKISEETSE